MIICSLYVPGDRPERFEKAMGSGADQVIIDLEDAVAEEAKDRARDATRTFLKVAGLSVDHEATIAVRINATGTAAHDADLGMLAGLDRLPTVRVPKVERGSDLDGIVARLGESVQLAALIESALGIEHAFEIASHRAVVAVALGEADLRAELGITADTGLDWIRVRLVVAARAAGLAAPNMAVYPNVKDLDGLRQSTIAGAQLGMVGRSAIHPAQVPVIKEAFRPSQLAVDHAHAVLAALDGNGVAVLPDGQMVDEAMAKEARRTLEMF